MKNFFMAGLIALVWISAAFADGDSRPATDDEKKFNIKITKIFESTVPNGPDGWEIADKTEIEPLEYVAWGQEDFPMTVYYHIKWRDGEKISEAESRIEKHLVKTAEEQEPDNRLEESTAELEKLGEELGKAFEKNDMKKVEELKKKMEKLSEKFNNAASDISRDFNQQISELTPHDVELQVYISANVFDQGFTQVPSGQTVIDGCKVIRINDEEQTSQGWNEGSTYIFVGNFQYTEEDDTAFMHAEINENAPHTKVQTAVIHIIGEKNRAEKFTKQINLKVLKALL